jgi:hypothetical protein
MQAEGGMDGTMAGRRPPVVVVQSPALPARVLALPHRHAVLPLPFTAVTRGLLDRLGPRAVALALFCPRHDATAVLKRLAQLGYRGRVFLLAPPLPDAAMVERELARQFPSLRLRVAQMPELGLG